MKAIALLALVIIISACTVKVAAPDKPITINLNVKIEHEVRIKVEKELEDLFNEDSDLF
jgi:Skp family chaperone for outer membrane proteins